MEQRGVTDHVIVKQLFIARSRRPLPKLRVVKIKVHGVGRERRTGHLGSHLKRNPFFWLNVKDQTVWSNHLVLVITEQRQGRSLKATHKFWGRLSHPLSECQI